MKKEDSVLVQRVSTALSLYPETIESDSALVYRVMRLYGISDNSDAESFLTLPKIYRIKQVAKAAKEHHHGIV